MTAILVMIWRIQPPSLNERLRKDYSSWRTEANHATLFLWQIVAGNCLSLRFHVSCQKSTMCRDTQSDFHCFIWLPDCYRQILILYAFGASGLEDYGLSMQNLIPWRDQIRPSGNTADFHCTVSCPHRIYSRLEAPLILQLCPLLLLPPDVGVHVLERRRRRGGGRFVHPQLRPPQLVQLREDLVLRHAQLLRVARGEAQEVIVARLQRDREMEKEGQILQILIRRNYAW